MKDSGRRVSRVRTRSAARAAGRIHGAVWLPPNLPWLQPYPGLLLEGAAPREGEPDAAAVSKARGRSVVVDAGASGEHGDPGGLEADRECARVFNYNWKTLEDWAGRCRELVLTRDDGRQHRAFFRFS